MLALIGAAGLAYLTVAEPHRRVARVPSTSIAGSLTPSRSTLTAIFAVNVDPARLAVPPIDVDGNSTLPTQSR